MPKVSKSNANDDVDFNRSILTYGESMRNAQSWLSHSLKVKAGNTSAENEQEEDADIEGDDDEGGLGLVASKNQSNTDRQSLSSNDKLRKQLLGKTTKYSKASVKQMVDTTNGLTASKPKPYVKKTQLQGSDDEAQGRTAVAKRKGGAPRTTIVRSSAGRDSEDEDTKSNSKKRANTYLDELLAQRKGKNKKQKLSSS